MTADPFDMTTWADGTPWSLPVRAAASVAGALLGFSRLRSTYNDARSRHASHFLDAILESLRVSVDCSVEDRGRIPASGPLVVLANHPHGALDGLVLASLMRQIRPDVRILANRLLARIPELEDDCFFVDPFGGPAASTKSRAGLRAAHVWLRQGHALIAFPAGEVAHRLDTRHTPHDSDWRDTAAALAVRNGAAVVPAYIEGRNGRLFYSMGRVHPLLRTALLPRQLGRAVGRAVAVRVGVPLRASVSADPAQLTRTAREAVDSLASNAGVVRDIEGLDDNARLITNGPYDVYCARGCDIPNVMLEIGRQRARAYHAAGEGTASSCDLDPFDDYYVQLFVWDRSSKRIVGAYRLVETTEAVGRHGVTGLYTRRLFDYEAAFLEKLGPAVELGRSWVMPEYQKNSSVLFLLWRGVGKYIAERTDARALFGAVSISPRYSDASQALMRAFLVANHFAPHLAKVIASNRPPISTTTEVAVPDSVDATDALVRCLESDGKRMPVLLRQYLKLDARAIAFNVDPEFGNAVDALMTVDLTTVAPGLLARYLGPDAAKRFALCAPSTATDRRAA